MKRLHVNLTVADLDQSVRFYSALFAGEPTVLKPDYAKWMLEDPRVNFSISTRGVGQGLDHLGIQVESGEELREIAGRLAAAGREVVDAGETHCCYARSDKAWIADPQGLQWETFFTIGTEAVYGDGLVTAAEPKAATRTETERPGSCCGPTAA
jgi:catechol 2,3-dioxygenase-like lactoylglutathione lyase family enzyme